MNALNVLRDRTDVFTELELTRCLHLLVYWSTWMSIFLWSKISLTPWPQQRPFRRFIQLRYNDLNPETLYKLEPLILFGADFDHNINFGGEVS